MAYPANSTVMLLATPNATTTFVGWSGACTGTDACVVDMAQERTVTAVFGVGQARRLRAQDTNGARHKRRKTQTAQGTTSAGHEERRTQTTTAGGGRYGFAVSTAVHALRS
jgi:hypothetical protein